MSKTGWRQKKRCVTGTRTMSTDDAAVSRQDVVFAGGTCRIEIRQRADAPGLPSFTARLWLVDEAGTASPLVLDRGAPAEIHGQSEALTLSSAITYLEHRFGALSEYAHPTVDWDEARREGPPIVIERI
jgi:hypothetical protein